MFICYLFIYLLTYHFCPYSFLYVGSKFYQQQRGLSQASCSGPVLSEHLMEICGKGVWILLVSRVFFC